MKIVPIILAAGGSPRLGFPKALARFGRRTAIEIAIGNCAGLATPVVVLGSQADEVRALLPGGTRLLVNSNWRDGQLSSFLAGLEAVPRGADFMLYPVDYPLLTPATIARLVHGFAEREAGQSIVAPVSRRRSGHPVLFASELRRELAAAETAREVVYRDAARVKFVSVRTEAIWQDLDSPAAYRARQRSFARRPAALAFAGASK